MYKLMIVDDDKIIRQSIIELIDWENSSFVLTGEGYDGADALIKIKQNPPDLVITDIFMPVKNGIELLTEVKKEFPDMMFLMLSNYDDFSYVRSAMKIGAFDYLLKFELNKEVLNQQLKNVRKKLDTNYLGYEMERCRLLFEPTAGREQVSGGLALSGLFLVGLCEENGEAVRALLASLPGKLHLPFDHILFSNQYKEHYLFLCYDKEVNKKEAQMELMGFLNWESSLGECSYMIAVSNFISEEEQFSKSYETCRKMLACAFYDCNIHVIMERNFKEFYQASSLETYRKEIPKIITQLQTNNMEEAVVILHELLFQMAADNLEPRQGLMVLEYLSHEINAFCQSFSISLPNCFLEGLLPGNYFARFCNIKEIEDAFFRLVLEMDVTDISGEAALSNSTVTNEIAQNAISFLTKNFSKQICLQDVADYVNVNKNHLCRVLRKHTGSSFNLLLNQMRIKYSKQLLKNTDMSMEMVANAAGFSDYRYFKKVFVNSTGVFPTEYRKNNQ